MAHRRMKLVGLGMVIASVVMTTAVLSSGMVLATPPVGAVTVLLAQGQNGYSRTIPSQAGTDVVTVQNTFPPAGSSGWHSHPGVAVVVVASGEITLNREPIGGGPCQVLTFTAGQTFFEWASFMQNGVNNGSVDAVVYVTFFNVPHAGSARIDQPDPMNCPA